MLLLFERPIDGLGIALDYARGLRELGDRPEVRQRKLALQARAGLHVGEVLTWRNSEAAVQAGAKPLEVEGLAKPLAGRLMTLARPGQILLSATAEPLARRASRELGERAEHLLWKSHGRWRLKGVPDGQEIFEVGEPGFAPLRAPKQNGGKAWRDIPVWRRPAALAAELLLVAGIATGAWFITRPTPAIAFNERDWVVVGDLRNLTGQPVLDESLEQAFRISLEQSRYVNVLSDLKVRDTLQLMKRGPATPLDRAIASEVAIRDGARAVILPTVAEVGGRVRVSAEVIDPHSQTTVYAQSFDGVGSGSTLGSIDKVTSELREKLGEAIASIERDSEPLPQVSTSNLDALKAYALGEEKYTAGDPVAALGYYKRALDLDPQFALARVALGRVEIGQGKLESGRAHLVAATAMQGRLTPRENLSLQTLLARFGPVPELLARWKQLIELYPDKLEAQLGFAQDSWMMANRYAEALPHARAASAKQSSYAAFALYLQGMLHLGQEQYPRAIDSFVKSRAAGLKGMGFNYAYAYEAQRDYAKADAIFGQRAGSSLQRGDMESMEYRFLTALDRGQWQAAAALLPEARKTAEADDPLLLSAMWRNYALAAAVLQGGDNAQALRDQRRWLQDHAARIEAIYAPLASDHRLAIGYLAARAGDRALLADALADLRDGASVRGYPMSEQAFEALQAERDRLGGKPALAVDRLRRIARGDEALLLVHASLARALADAGQTAAAIKEWEWVAAHRGRAFVERSLGGLMTPMYVAETTLANLEIAELLAKQGARERSAKALAAFTGAWQPEGLPRATQARVAALRNASAIH
jgi:putative peptide modification system cyclase